MVLRHLPAEVSGLQHFHKIVSSAIFRPTECLMAPSLCFPRAVLCSGTPARGLGPLDYTPRRTEVLFRPQRQGGLLEATNGGTLSKTSSQRGSAPGARTARRPAWQHQSADVGSRLHGSDAGPPGSRRAHND